MTQRSSHSLGVFFALLAAFLFSSKPILIKLLYASGMTPTSLMTWRMLLALPVYLFIGGMLWCKHRPEVSLRSNLVFSAAGVGVLGYYLASYLDLYGLQYVSAQLERVVLYAYPSFVVVLGAIFWKAEVSKKIVMALFLSYLGIAAMYGQDISLGSGQGDGQGLSRVTLGTLLIIGSALAYALYVLLSKKFIGIFGSLMFTCIAMASASMATLIHYSLVEGISLPPIKREYWWPLLCLVVFATIIPAFLLSEAIKFIGSQKVSITGTLGPVATTALAIGFLGEAVSWLSIIGMGFVIFGVSLLRKP